MFILLSVYIQRSIHVSGTNVDDHTYCTSNPNLICHSQRTVQEFNVLKLNNPTSNKLVFFVDSLFMCSMYLSVQKHRQTKGNFTPKLMFLDVNVSWGKKNIAIFFGQVLAGFLHQALTVYRPIWSTVLTGFHI